MHGDTLDRDEIAHGARVAVAATILAVMALLVGAGLSVWLSAIGVI